MLVLLALLITCGAPAALAWRLHRRTPTGVTPTSRALALGWGLLGATSASLFMMRSLDACVLTHTAPTWRHPIHLVVLTPFIEEFAKIAVLLALARSSSTPAAIATWLVWTITGFLCFENLFAISTLDPGVVAWGRWLMARLLPTLMHLSSGLAVAWCWLHSRPASPMAAWRSSATGWLLACGIHAIHNALMLIAPLAVSAIWVVCLALLFAKFLQALSAPSPAHPD